MNSTADLLIVPRDSRVERSMKLSIQPVHATKMLSRLDIGSINSVKLTTQNAIAPTPFNPEQDAVRDAYFAIMKAY